MFVLVKLTFPSFPNPATFFPRFGKRTAPDPAYKPEHTLQPDLFAPSQWHRGSNRFVVIGDAGSGAQGQHDIARQMGALYAGNPFRSVLVLGDNDPELRDVQELMHRQEPAELRARLDALHPADIAYLLEALPPEERLAVWDLVKADRDGEILVEVSDAVRESLIEAMDPKELVAAAETLEADELADIAGDLPPAVIAEVVQALPPEEREQLRAALSYPEGSVGALMDFDHVAVREDVTLEAVTRYLRRMDELPDHTDQLFVVDRDRRLRGSLPLARLIVADLDLEVDPEAADATRMPTLPAGSDRVRVGPVRAPAARRRMGGPGPGHRRP